MTGGTLFPAGHSASDDRKIIEVNQLFMMDSLHFMCGNQLALG
jgi:hypothetical protein